MNDRKLNIYIGRIMKKNTDRSLSSVAKNELSIVLYDLIKDKIVYTALNFMHNSERKTLLLKDIISATKSVLNQGIQNHAIVKIQEAIVNFEEIYRDKRVSGAEKAKIIVSPALMKNWLREDNNNINISKNTPVALAALVDYLISEILDVSVEYNKRNSKKKIIDYDTIKKAIVSDDKDLKCLLCDMF